MKVALFCFLGSISFLDNIDIYSKPVNPNDKLTIITLEVIFLIAEKKRMAISKKIGLFPEVKVSL